jgi:hypothetical protein
MWGKLYRKSSLNAANIQPTGITTGEDLAFNLQLFPYLSKIYILKECGYNYRFGGMTTRYNTCLLPDLKKLFEQGKVTEKYVRTTPKTNFVCRCVFSGIVIAAASVLLITAIVRLF